MVKNNKPSRSSKHFYRMITRLNREHLQFPDAKVLRYLVRHWSEDN